MKKYIYGISFAALLSSPMLLSDVDAAMDCNNKKIEYEISKTLNKDNEFEVDRVNYFVKDCKVTLSGQVTDLYEKNVIRGKVSDVEGVYAIDDTLLIVDTNKNSSYVISKTDEEIKKDIERSYFMSFKLDSDDISVFVDDRVATLIGEVDTLYEKNLAGQKAINAGALIVNNNLKH